MVSERGNSPWVTRNLEGAQYAEPRGSTYEGQAGWFEEWDEDEQSDACDSDDATPEYAQVTRHDMVDLVIVLVAVFLLVGGLCLLLSRTAWAS